MRDDRDRPDPQIKSPPRWSRMVWSRAAVLFSTIENAPFALDSRVAFSKRRAWSATSDRPFGRTSRGGGKTIAGSQDPLDRWSKDVLTAVAARFGAMAVFPSDRPYLPFQQWGMYARGTARFSTRNTDPSAIRALAGLSRGAAVRSRARISLAAGRQRHPCDDCQGQAVPFGLSGECLSPIGGYDVAPLSCPPCFRRGGVRAWSGGCLARRACPAGTRVRLQRAADALSIWRPSRGADARSPI